MSIVVFWSPYHGQGQSSNLHCTSLIMGLLHKKSVLMMQTHFARNNLESPLIGENVSIKKANDLFVDIGLDAAVTYSSMNKMDKERLESCCISFEDTSLLLLPGTEIKNRETFDRDIGKVVRKVIMDAQENVDIVMVDANSGDDKMSSKIMEQADLIVVNLTQRKYVLNNLFEEYEDKFLDNNKVFYLFGDYDDNSCYNINNLRSKYSKFITKKNSGVIPYCVQYSDAQNNGEVIKFIQNGLHLSVENTLDKAIRLAKGVLRTAKYPSEETEYFFHRSKLSVEKMFRLLGIPVRKDRREES